jgi:hypothetical protein
MNGCFGAEHKDEVGVDRWEDDGGAARAARNDGALDRHRSTGARTSAPQRAPRAPSQRAGDVPAPRRGHRRDQPALLGILQGARHRAPGAPEESMQGRLRPTGVLKGEGRWSEVRV